MVALLLIPAMLSQNSATLDKASQASCFLLKHKISEQQINLKVLSVASSCHYNGNSKNGKKSFIDKCPPLGSYPNKSPSSGQKLGCKSPRVGANFWCKSPGVRGGRDGCGWNWYLHYTVEIEVKIQLTKLTILLSRYHFRSQDFIRFYNMPCIYLCG